MNYSRTYLIKLAAILSASAWLAWGCSSSLKYKSWERKYVPLEGGWTWPRHDRDNTGHINIPLGGALELRWKCKTAAVVTGGLVGNQQFIIAGDMAGNLYLINPLDGQRIGKKSFRGAFTAPMVIVDSLLYYALNIRDERFGIMNLRNGKILWQRPAKDINSSFTIERGILYIGDGTGIVSAWRSQDGSRIWAMDIGSGISGGCVLSDSLILAASNDGEITALGIADGKRVWARDLETAIIGWLAVKDSFLFCTGLDSMVYALNKSDGSIIWSYKTGGGIRGGVSIAGDSLYVCSNDGRLYALDLLSGGLHFAFETGGPIVGAPLVTESEIIIGSLSGYLYVLDRFSGRKLYEYDADSPIITSPILIGNKVIFACGNREIIALQARHKF